MADHTTDTSQEHHWRKPGLDAYEMWEAMSEEERCEVILATYAPAQWFVEPALPTLAHFYRNKPVWGHIKATFTERGGNSYDLEQAAKAYGASHRNGHAPVESEAIADRTAPLAPELPRAARMQPLLAANAAPWLQQYVDHSAKWSPRAAHGFHVAAGLWMLSTIAARRIRVEMGSAIYPTLFLAMVARSTLYAKTTTAKIAIDGLRQAGCGHLLAADRSTPQALIRSMAGHLPPDYGSRPPEAQEALAHRVAFAAQRGWYFEEWGGLLHQMTRKDSPMSEFHGLLRVLDDGYDSFESETIQRGLDHVTKPYLSLLASATPHDLAKFLVPGASWWHDGFWPRIAFIVPLPDELPSQARRSMGTSLLPEHLVKPLQTWHRQLGVPTAHVEAAINAAGKPTGEWHATCSPLPCQLLGIHSDVKEAYDVYNESLLQLVINGDATGDLEACYGRLHDKALRIAMLLASFAGQAEITMPYWAYAQNVAETWRRMLHQTLAMASEGQPMSREEQLESKIESQLARYVSMTGRDLQRHIKGFSSREINGALEEMLKAERIITETSTQTTHYRLPLIGEQKPREVMEEVDC